jgi:hypothetical protein
MKFIRFIYFLLSECYTIPGFQRLHGETGFVCVSHDQRGSGGVFVRSVVVV